MSLLICLALAGSEQLHTMPYREMAQMMGMDDRRRFGKVMFDRLEWRDADASTYAWDASAWYGGDFNKLWVETEGEHVDGATHGARLELLWDHIVSPWWSTRLGWRRDFGDGPERGWLAFGVAGITPGLVDLEATAYAGQDGDVAFRLSTDYDLLLTQRLVLQPQAEANFYSGVTDFEIGLRLRYEFRREIAPYLGISWKKASGQEPDGASAVAGIRLWF